jgi:hypothetical protein
LLEQIGEDTNKKLQEIFEAQYVQTVGSFRFQTKADIDAAREKLTQTAEINGNLAQFKQELLARGKEETAARIDAFLASNIQRDAQSQTEEESSSETEEERPLVDPEPKAKKPRVVKS